LWITIAGAAGPVFARQIRDDQWQRRERKAVAVRGGLTGPWRCIPTRTMGTLTT
jgi:hypothetical protein